MILKNRVPPSTFPLKIGFLVVVKVLTWEWGVEVLTTIYPAQSAQKYSPTDRVGVGCSYCDVPCKGIILHFERRTRFMGLRGS